MTAEAHWRQTKIDNVSEIFLFKNLKPFQKLSWRFHLLLSTNFQQARVSLLCRDSLVPISPIFQITQSIPSTVEDLLQNMFKFSKLVFDFTNLQLINLMVQIFSKRFSLERELKKLRYYLANETASLQSKL